MEEDLHIYQDTLERQDAGDVAGTDQASHDVQALRKVIQDMAVEHERAMADVLRRLEQVCTAAPRVTVQVQPPPRLPKLHLLTGLPPANQQEVSYAEWREQAMVVMEDECVDDKLTYMKRSLRSVALAQFHDSKPTGGQELIELFDRLFGCVKSAEDLYLDICQMRQGRESAAEFLTMLCGKLREVKRKAGFNDTEFHRRLYLVFTRACTCENLCREVRSRYGIPGEAKPTFEEVLQYLRRVEDQDGARRLRRSSTTQVHTLVADSQPADSGKQDTAATKKAKVRYCFHCGQAGHFYEQCQNQANPTLVAERDREQRRLSNQWRLKKGLPALPLN